MDSTGFNQMRDQIEKRYRQKMEAARAEYVQAMSALEILRKSFEYTDGHEMVHVGPVQSTLQTTLIGAIREIIPQIDGQFDINTIRNIIEDKYPLVKKPLNPTTISNHLRTLWAKGLIVQLHEGAGPKPSVYTISTRWLSENEDSEIENVSRPELLFFEEGEESEKGENE